MKKSYYYYLAVAVAAVTAFTAVASADQAPYRQRGPYGQPYAGQPYAQDDQQPLPLPTDDQPPQQCQGPGCPPPCQTPGCNQIGVLPGGINVQGTGNTVIIQMGQDGQAYRAVVPAAACHNHYACQQAIATPYLTWQPILPPQWGCGYGYGCNNVPTYYNYGSYGVPYFAQYAYQGAQFFVYSPYGRGVVGNPYGFHPRLAPALRYPARRWR